MERVRIAVFPKDDEALRAHAEAILPDVGDPSECERRLRSVFPAVAVREQVPLASMGGRRWYVYRDGSALTATQEQGWDSPGTGTLFISRDGRYLAADQTAADIYGVPLQAIPGARVGAFTRHEGNDEGGRRAFERLAETGTLSSTAVVLTPDGREWPIRYRIDVDGDAYRMLIRRREG